MSLREKLNIPLLLRTVSQRLNKAWDDKITSMQLKNQLVLLPPLYLFVLCSALFWECCDNFVCFWAGIKQSLLAEQDGMQQQLLISELPRCDSRKQIRAARHVWLRSLPSLTASGHSKPQLGSLWFTRPTPHDA